MTVVVHAFARIREILGAASHERELPAGATAGDVWLALARDYPDLEPLRRSTRLVRAGALVAADEPLRDRDELALLPPFGGG